MRISMIIALALPLLAPARPIIVTNAAAEPSTLADVVSTAPGLNIFSSDASGAAFLNKNVLDIKISERAHDTDDISEESSIPDVLELEDSNVAALDMVNEPEGNTQGPGENNRRSGISILDNPEIQVSDAGLAKSICLLRGNPAECHRKKQLQKDIAYNGMEGKMLPSL